jgi:PAS domain S-box-containing protein
MKTVRKDEEESGISGENLGVLFKESTVGILIAEIKTRKIKHANPAICRMLDYTVEELTGTRVEDLHPKDELENALSEFEALARGGKSVSENISCVRNDGTTFFADIHTSTALIEGIEYTLGLFIDITERKQAEKVLRENEKQNYFQAEMLRNAPVIAAFHDRELNMIWANKAYEEATGLTVQAIAGRKCYSVWGLSKPCRHCPVVKAVESGEVSKAELTPQNQDHWPETQGSWLASAAPVWDQDGRILGAIEIAIDISESKLKEKQEYLVREVLELLTHTADVKKTIGSILQLIKNRMDFEAVGIRLQEGDDYPYFEANGFSEDFLLAERYLCERNEAGEVMCDAAGNPVLECMCGNVLRGRTDPALPFFTVNGSFWANSTTQLLATTSEADRQARTRNRCNGEGYESVALIPLNADGEIIGLLQLNDRRPNRFNPEMINFFEGLGGSIGIALAQKQAEEEIEKLARFPSENPNPVLRASKDGIIIFCNKTGDHLLKAWKCRIGEALPEELCAKVMEVSRSGTVAEIEIECDDRTFSTTLAPIEGKGYVNIYWQDITERKLAEEELKKYHSHLEELVEERTKELTEKVTELERFHDATIDRELRMHEMRVEMEKLKAQINTDKNTD